MRIFIPTRDRIDAQFTWDNMPPVLRQHVTLVVPEDQVQAHRDRSRNVIARPPVPLASVRQWLVDEALSNGYGNEPLIMCDDDLAFFVRKNPDAHNLRPATGEETYGIFSRLHDFIANGQWVHAGLSPRQGNNWLFPDSEVKNTRMNAVHAILPMALLHYAIRYDDVIMMEDYHVTLSLFERGEDNIQIADAAWDQCKGSGAPGGFTHYRTSETQAAAAKALAALHPNSVTLVEKTPKTGAGGFSGTRLDVRVAWAKTRKNGQTATFER